MNDDPQRSDSPAPSHDGGARGLELMQKGVVYIEQGIAAVVVLLLVVGALMVFWGVVTDLVSAFPGGLGEHGLTEVLSQALLALMIAEIISSVASFFERRGLDAVPLLVIGIIASIRRLLVISAEAANFVSEGSEIPQSMLIELAILTVSVGIFAWSMRQVGGTRQAT